MALGHDSLENYPNDYVCTECHLTAMDFLSMQHGLEHGVVVNCNWQDCKEMAEFRSQLGSHVVTNVVQTVSN